MLASLVIPTYNASATIIGCLDSIYGLVWHDMEFEVIVVDDGSSDNTVEIVERYMTSYSNMVLIRQPENHRQGSARNVGIDCAKGDYIVFVDCDDEVDVGMVSALRMAANKGLDMAAMRIAKMSEKREVEAEITLPYSESYVFTGVELQKEHPFWFSGVVAYVYRLAFLKEVGYPFVEDVFYEDPDFLYAHLYYAKRISYCNECGYNVIFNSASVTHTFSYRHLSDYALLGTRMLGLCESFGDMSKDYSESMAVGGSYNLNKAFRMLFRLNSIKDIRAFYERFDASFDQKLLADHKKHTLKLTRWTFFCLKHHNAAILIIGLVSHVLLFMRKHLVKR